MKIYDRHNRQYIEEQEYGQKALHFLYETFPGRVLLKIFFCRRIYSKIQGCLMRTRYSARKIKPFCEKYNIDISEFGNVGFKCFDDFFTRKYRFETNCTENELSSPCCGRLSAYRIDDNLTLQIKGSTYTLRELVDGHFDISEYGGGVCLVYRLAVEDCHRYVFPDDGTILDSRNVKGILHTVRPLSTRYRVFCRNHRICTLMHTKHFGQMIQIEVGALQIGAITNHNITAFSRMEEKGFFSYGGSTIIQLVQKNIVSVDGDIMEHSARDIEVLVKTGEKIARRTKC